MGYNINMTVSKEQAAPGPFELSGGALCLDFANTWENQSDPSSDRLRDHPRLVAFGRQTGCLTEGDAAVLSRIAIADEESAAVALAFGRELRHRIYRIFSSRAGGRPVPAEDIDRIGAVLRDALSHRRLEPRDGGFVWRWTGAETGDLRAPIWPVIESAVTLLTSEELGRVRECDADNCNWLFLDRSRAGTRRWCSMNSCGNRAKARRHYRRQRKS